MFLLVLNLFLLAVGWLMEIFAAIVVVVPLIVPLGAAFGIHPGASRHHLHRESRARVPDAARRPEHLPRVVPLQAAGARGLRAALPMMAILGIGVLVITYVPWLTTGLLALLGR